jgi:hypothetical protein
MQMQDKEASTMPNKSRGVTLTILAALFALLAISNFAKPLSHDPHVGFVFLGTRLSGMPNMILGPLFGIILAVYAYGVFALRKFALPIAYVFTVWVVVNMIMYTIKHQSEPQPQLAFAIGSTVVGIGVPLVSAIVLYRRRADLT